MDDMIFVNVAYEIGQVKTVLKKDNWKQDRIVSTHYYYELDNIPLGYGYIVKCNSKCENVKSVFNDIEEVLMTGDNVLELNIDYKPQFDIPIIIYNLNNKDDDEIDYHYGYIF
jgi:hypothetical protein